MPTSIDDPFETTTTPGRPRWSVNGRAFSPACWHSKSQVHVGMFRRRVPANQITGLEPGEVFAPQRGQRGGAQRIWCLSTIQYAVDQLKVEHLMVVGHWLRRCTGCAGRHARGAGGQLIRHVTDVRDRHRDLIASVDRREWRHDVLCELNAIEQVVNIAQTTVMLDAWGRGQKVTLHGWCYGLEGRAHQQPAHDGRQHRKAWTLCTARRSPVWPPRAGVMRPSRPRVTGDQLPPAKPCFRNG